MHFTHNPNIKERKMKNILLTMHFMKNKSGYGRFYFLGMSKRKLKNKQPFLRDVNNNSLIIE